MPTSRAADAAPYVVSISPPPESYDLARDASITVTFSEPVDLLPRAMLIRCPAARGQPFKVTEVNKTVFTMTPMKPFLAGERCFVIIEATRVIDVDTDDPPDTMTENYRAYFSFTPPDFGAIQRASLLTDGAQGNGDSGPVSLSGDGQYVAFISAASNLVTGDTNGVPDVFLRDRLHNLTTRVSVASDGTQANGTLQNTLAMSNTGQWIAFVSDATILVSSDTNAANDVFIHEVASAQTTRVSVDSAGVEGNADSVLPSLSGDGRYVAFVSSATNLVSGDGNGAADVFVRDRQTNQTIRVSVDSVGTEANGASTDPVLSANGQVVAFKSSATNLVAGDSNPWDDVFVRDLGTNQTTRISVSSSLAQANGPSFPQGISADGRYVLFHSNADNLVSGDTNLAPDLFVHDRNTGQTTRVSVASDGSQHNGGLTDTIGGTLSADGRFVVFSSGATNLVSGDSNGVSDTFVHDRLTGRTWRVSQSAAGVQGNGNSTSPMLSANGRFVGFYSAATNLVSGDSNGVPDVFVAPSGSAPDTIGVYRTSTSVFNLRGSNTTGPADISTVFGTPGDLPVTGDWNGDNVDTIGVYRPSTTQFFLKEASTSAAPVVYSFALGVPGDVPLAGDWDGNGSDEVGLYRPSSGLALLWYYLSTGPADYVMPFGAPNDNPLTGDWDGDGKDSIGVYRSTNAAFYLTNTLCNCTPTATYGFTFGVAGDVPISGDWDGNGTSGIGVFRPTNGRTFLRNTLSMGIADIEFTYGIAGDRPLAGRWAAPAPLPSNAPIFETGR